MPKVSYTKAGKDYPEKGIKKGEMYYHWSFFRGPKLMSKTRPKPSETTASPNLSAAYAAQEAYEYAIEQAKCPEDFVTAKEDAVALLDDVLSEYDDSISNLEEAFSGGCPALEEKQEQRDAVESFKDEIEAISFSDVSDFEDGVEDFESLSDEKKEEMLETLREEAMSVTLEI